MNCFHILSLCVRNGDIAGAMRVLRDKSEFAVLKILKKIKVKVTSLTGRALWHDVQRWLFTRVARRLHCMSLPVPDVLHRIHTAESLSPAALDMIKVLALIAMLVDHTNTLLMTPPEPLMYALGRMAFPLFTLIWAMNVQRTPERLQRRANRLWMWAAVTQPVFSLAFVGHQPWWALNILFVFAGVTQLLALQYRFGAKGMTAGVLLLAILVWPLSPASFSLAGLTLACGMVSITGGQSPAVRRAGTVLCILSLVCLNGITHLLSLQEDTLLLATLPTLIFPLAAISMSRWLFPSGERRFMLRHFFYMAYAGHLFIIAVIVQVIR